MGIPEINQSGINGALLDQFLKYDRERRRLEAELSDVKERIEDLGARILPEMEAAGISGVNVDRSEYGVGNVYIRRQVWAGVETEHGGRPTDQDYAEANEALRAAGYGELIKERFNTQQLSAVVRELENDAGDFTEWEDILPEEFIGNIKVTETYKLITRR